jgi:hypothetical protein
VLVVLVVLVLSCVEVVAVFCVQALAVVDRILAFCAQAPEVVERALVLRPSMVSYFVADVVLKVVVEALLMFEGMLFHSAYQLIRVNACNFYNDLTLLLKCFQ